VAASITLATFNLKDFFPQPPHDFAPKVDAMAAKLVDADADVVALQEVGAPATMTELLAKLAPHAYASVLGTADARGIRCALLSRVPIATSRVHTAASLRFPTFQDGDPPPFGERIPLRRGVVVARVETVAFAIDVIVAHFKSRRWVARKDASGASVDPATPRERAEAELRSFVWRAAEALCVRGLVDDALASRPDAMVAVMGDLNDTIDSTPVRMVADRDLVTCADVVPESERFSVMHGGARAQIDHILASAPLRARLTGARFLNRDLRDPPPTEPGAPPTTDSDHAPFVARFEAA
jgi:endonuclease/exonuclease/phosphatase family metal-dependent hydrolase